MSDSDGTPLLVAGGAGGGAMGDPGLCHSGTIFGGAGGGSTGGKGSDDFACSTIDFGAYGGTQSQPGGGGAGGGVFANPGTGPLVSDNGIKGLSGGNGAPLTLCTSPEDLFNVAFGGGGGGGGGYFGGGGGGPCAGGGGGSGYVIPSALSGSTGPGGSLSNGEVDITYTVQPPTITSASDAFFEQGHGGSFTVTATGNPAPTFSETGTLPTGVTLSGGVLSGTPTQSGSFPITITATNGFSPNAIQSFTLVVNAPPAVTSANSTTFAEGVADAFTVTATGFPGPTFTKTGTLPTGVTFTSAGVLSGTPTQLGSFPITLTASNGITPNATQSFTLTVSHVDQPGALGRAGLGLRHQR